MNLAPHGPLPLYAVGLAMGIGLTGAGTTLAARRRPHQSTTASITRNWTEAIDLPSLALSLIAAAVSAVVTGWPVAGLLTGIAVYGVPRLLRQTSAAASIATLEAIATWTEMLQGTLAASAGLGQAIIATADLSPVPIRSATEQLAAQIRSGVEPRVALLRFADEVADPCADRVVCSLLLAFSSRAQRLGDLLTALAESTREEVSLRLRVETSRASVRSGVRTVVVFSVAFAALLALFARSYLAPFGTVEGQLVLVVVGGLYAAGLTLMVALARPPRAIRLLGADVEER
jgi:hypothetical protein